MKKIIILIVCIILTQAVATRTFAGLSPGDYYPDLAFDSENNLYLLSFIRNDAEITIQAQLVNPDATLNGSELNPSTTTYTGDPHAAYDPLLQDYLLVWAALDVDSNIYGQLVGSDGAMIGEHFSIADTDVGYNQFCPALAFDSVNGRFLAVWNDNRDGDYHIYAQLVNADGTLQGTNFVVYDDDLVDSTYCPVVAYDDTNQRFLVTWAATSGRDIFGQLVNAGGSLNGTSFTISAELNSQWHPSVVYNGTDKQYLVVWEDLRDGVSASIYGQIVGADGALSGSNIPIDTGATNRFAPSVAYSSDDNSYLVVWSREQSPTEFFVDAQYLKAGALEGSVFQPSSDQNSGSMKPALAYNFLCKNFLLTHVTDAATAELRYLVVGDPCETTPPTVTATDPAADAEDVAVDSAVTATFDEAMRESTLNSNTFSLSGSEAVDGTVTYDADTKTATFTPAADLSSATTYTATITTGVKDVVGNSMSGEFTWSFTTASEPDDGGDGGDGGGGGDDGGGGSGGDSGGGCSLMPARR